MGSIIVAVIFIFGFPIAFFIILRSYLRLKKKLKEMSAISEAAFDIDAYAAAKHTEADFYAANKQAEADQAFSAASAKIATLERKIEALTQQRKELSSEVKSLELDVLLGAVRIDDYQNMKSDEIKNELVILRGQQDALLKNGDAVEITNTEFQKKFINTQIKQILRCFNAECVGILGGVTVKNVDASRAKIQQSFSAINKIFSSDGVQISDSYLSLKLQELSLIYAYMLKEDEERVQRKAIREQMVEEEKVRREIEREKAKIEKEETQFNNEVKKLMSYMQKSQDSAERQLYIDKINELQERIKQLEVDKKNVFDREQNTRAGFVYIISNIGSFGDQAYKIGMTRRLEPMDRISELSSASVPFPFDVHAMIFSDDAPGLETVLHQYFDSKRINKVNPRKEFFRVDLEEIKKVVLKNHNATVRFIDIPDAIEYRETIRLEAQEQDNTDRHDLVTA